MNNARWIWVNERRFRIQSNLSDALRAVREKDRPLVLWVDAVCINQVNKVEKSHQVTMMGKIYGTATEVVVWLGLATAQDELAFASLERHDGLAGNPLLNEAMNIVLKRQYWDRAWIRQEVLLGKSVKIRWGRKQFSFGEFVAFYACISSGHALDELKRTVTGGPVSPMFVPHGKDTIMKLAVDRDPRYEITSNLETLLGTYGDANCLDPRDKVYSLLSLASDCQDGNGPSADYDISMEFLFLALMHFCRPEDPLAFGRKMASMFQLNADTMRHIVLQKDTLGQERCSTSVTNQMAFAIYDHLQCILARAPGTAVADVAPYMLVICDVLEMDSLKETIPLAPSDELCRIRDSDVLLLFRTSLAGPVLRGLYKFRQSGDDTFYRRLIPVGEYWTFRQANEKRLGLHIFVAKKIAMGKPTGYDFDRVMALLQDEMKRLDIAMICLVLDELNSGRWDFDPEPPGVRLDLRSCRLLLEEAYGLDLLTWPHEVSAERSV